MGLGPALPWCYPTPGGGLNGVSHSTRQPRATQASEDLLAGS